MGVWGPLRFCRNFKVDFPNSAKNITGSLIETVLNLYIALGSTDILTILSL